MHSKLFSYYLLFIITINTQAQTKNIKTDWANLNKYEAENKLLKPVLKNDTRVVFMGNSITESWKKIDSNFFKNTAYINRGISGQTTDQMLIRFRQDVISLNPTLVVILAGINDIAQNNGPISLENILGNIISMVELAKANKIKVILCSVLPAVKFSWRPEMEPAEKVIQLNKMIEQYCLDHTIPYANYYSKMVDEQKGLNKEFTKDGVHPTLAGYKIMEPIIEKIISKTLRK